MSTSIVENEAQSAVQTDAYGELMRKIETREARLGVLGLGHVGLPLALALHESGFDVTGIDIDTYRVNSIQAGRSYITHIADEELHRALAGKRFRATSDAREAGRMDVISICVPAPLGTTREPDMSCIMAAAESIARGLRPGQLVILESTAYPGATEELVLPLFETGGLAAGRDFFLAYSPQRADSGDRPFNVRDVIKVVGGVTPRCADLAAELYGSSMRQVLVLSSARVAEMVKLLENTFHNVNVALVNEIAMMCSRMGIEVSEVIRGAATKPFGFIPFFPGAGLSGYSSPIDPLYREWTPKRGRMEAPLIDLADRINGDMPEFVAARAVELLNGQGKTLRGSRIHVLGVTRLKDAGDSREAPAIKVIGRLAGLGAKVTYSDPFVRALNIEGRRFESVLPMPERLRAVDLAIIGTGHSSFDYSAVVRSAPLVFDTSNATCGMQAENLVRL